jgi:hypothetical protein
VVEIQKYDKSIDNRLTDSFNAQRNKKMIPTPKDLDHFYRNESPDHPHHMLNRYHEHVNPRTKGLPVDEFPIPLRLIPTTHKSHNFQGYVIWIGCNGVASFSKNGPRAAMNTFKAIAEALRWAGLNVLEMNETNIKEGK